MMSLLRYGCEENRVVPIHFSEKDHDPGHFQPVDSSAFDDTARFIGPGGEMD